MALINNTIKEKIDEILHKNGEIVLLAYALLESTESEIEYVIKHALKGHDTDNLYTPIYSCIKELTTNAIKANIKKVLIKEGAVKDPSIKTDIISAIKKVLNEKDMLKYGIKCKDYHLASRIYLKIEKDKLTIRVINPVPVSDEELAHINNKIKTAHSYDSLADIYMENPDPLAEGMGLGLSMIVVLLKGIEIDPANFTLSTDHKTKTIAQIIIPL
jgi:hypothetical protein